MRISNGNHLVAPTKYPFTDAIPGRCAAVVIKGHLHDHPNAVRVAASRNCGPAPEAMVPARLAVGPAELLCFEGLG
jgi:hypothetical protein